MKRAGMFGTGFAWRSGAQRQTTLPARFAVAGLIFVAAALASTSPARAAEFDIPLPVGEDGIHAALNTTVTAGVGLRTQNHSVNLIGKSDLNPNVCNTGTGTGGTIYYQSCQGVFRDQSYPAARLAQVPGEYSMREDDGDLNYARGTLFQAPIKVTPDLTLTYKDFGFFGRVLYFYDFVNDDFIENHPNEITPQNLATTGRYGTAAPLPAALTPLLGIVPGLNSTNLTAPQRLYGPGALVRSKRTDGPTLRQVGTNLQYLDSYFYGKLPIPFTDDKNLTFKIGRQNVSWGESTILVINSINNANPINVNNYERVGNQLEEDFTPVNMVFLSAEPLENTTLEGFYQLEWQPTEAPAPGSYFSSNDVGTAGAVQGANLAFGGSADDPANIGRQLDNPLGLITYTTAHADRSADMEPRTSGQYGIKLGYYADWLNGGTDISGYYEHYHSRLPYVGFFALDAACGRAEGNTRNNNALDIVSFFQDCPNAPALSPTGTVPPPHSKGYDDVALNSGRFFLQYPEDIDLFGISFSTTVGDYSLQGEVSYRPNLPMQVSVADLEFAAASPTLTRCNDPNIGGTGVSCSQGVSAANLTSELGAGAANTLLNTLTTALNSLGITVPGGGGASVPLPNYGNAPNGGQQVYNNSGYLNPDGSQGSYNDYLNLIVGNVPGSARSFPNFITSYRGGVVGEHAATDFSKPLDRRNPGYIQGYERFQLLQFDLGITRVLGASDNPFGADQLIILGEIGANYVPDLPPLDRLQIDGPNTPLSATAGADGSGFRLRDPSQPVSASNPYIAVGGDRLACAGIKDCSYGPDGLRFNPHQQYLGDYVDKLSYGYRLVITGSYENVLPEIGLHPFILAKQDIQGTSPGPGFEFVAGRKEVDFLLETRYRSSLSFNVGYTWYWGGGDQNVLSDRDFAQAFVKFQF